LLSQEASDIQLELLEYARTITHNMLGDIALNDAWLTQALPSSLSPSYQSKLILRPGTAYYDGLLYRMESGLDPKVAASYNQPVTLGSPNDPGGKVVDFTGLASGYYKLIVQAQEEQVTALQDTFLQGAAVPETTEQKRRLIYTVVPVPCDVNGNLAPTDYTIGNTSGLNPLTFTRTDNLTSTQQTQFFSYNDLFKIDVTANTIVPTTDTLGSTAVVTFSNVDGEGTIFPTGPLMSQIFTNGFLVDPDGTYFYITAVQVSTGPDQISFTISQELAVPAGTGYQPNPNLSTLGLKYSLIPRDVVTANPSTGIPIGTRNYPVSIVYWNGSNFGTAPFGITSSEGTVSYNIQDLRNSATQNTISTVSDKVNWVLTGGGSVDWDLATSTLYWSSQFIIEQPTDPSLSYIINASDTMTLFGTPFAENEVLYFVIPPNASGPTVITLQKDARGTGDLAKYQTEDIVIFAYRLNGQIYSTHSGLNLISPVYDERILYPSGLPANTPITLPNNSRNDNLAQTYSPLGGNLLVFVNQLFKFQANDMSADWYSPSDSSTQIAFTYDLPNNAEVHFRIESPTVSVTSSPSGIPKVTLWDTIDTTLPATLPVTIDSTTVSNGNTVVFTNLSSGNNEVYEAIITGAGPTPTLPNPIVLQTSNANPYAGGTLESVVNSGNVATPITGSDAYFEIDGTTSGSGTSSLAEAYWYTTPTTFSSASTAIKIAQPFSAASTGSLGTLSIQIGQTNNTQTGYVSVSIQTDNSGAPSGINVTNVVQVLASSLPVCTTTPYNLSPLTIAFSSGSLTSGTTYHVVLDMSTVVFGTGDILTGLQIQNLTNPPQLYNYGAGWTDIIVSGDTTNMISAVTTGDNLLASSVNGAFNGAYSPQYQASTTATIVAVPFTPSISGTSTSILYNIGSFATFTGSYTVGIYNDSSGTPGSLIADVTMPAAALTTTSLMQWTLANISAALTGGTQYWIEWNFANIVGFTGPYIAINRGYCAASSPPEFSLSTNSGATFTPQTNQTIVFAVLSGGSGPVVFAENMSINATQQETTNTTSLGQTFTASASGTLTDAIFQLSVLNASPPNSGNLVVNIYEDNAGQPGLLIASSSTLDSSTLTTTPTLYTFTFGSGSLTSGSVYHAIVNTSGLMGTSGSGSISWQAQPIFNSITTPTGGDLLVVTKGSAHANTLIEFTGVTWAPISGGGGSQSLQSAYSYGNSITTSPSVPFTVTSGGGKAAQFNGDIGVTGIIDPVALELSPQASNPLPGSTPGCYVDSSGNFITYNGSVTQNVTQSINDFESSGVSSLNTLTGALTIAAGSNITVTPSGGNTLTIASTAGNSTYFSMNLLNNSGSTIPANSPVYMSAAGQISLANCTNVMPAASIVIGITTAAITNGTSGPVAYSGYITGVASGLTTGSYAYLSSTGTLTNTPPSTPGYEVVILGVVNGNDLFLQIMNIGTN
jgi:hypothetical protein